MFAKMTKTLSGAARAGVAAIALSAVAVGAALAAEITGAGATFPAPVYTKWAEQYAAQGGDTLNYQAIGSGAGVTQIINRTVDFGASDAAVAPERLASQQLLQFPAVIGGVVIAVNIPGVDGNALRLTGPIIADMYLGKIRLWNDARIRAINPGLPLPAIAVAPAYRADSSGTTNIFSSYLASVSLPFSTRIGAGNSVAWVAGVGAPGNAGVAGTVRNTRGGLGYVEFAYATENHMQTPMMLNRSGKYVAPSGAAFAASAATVNWATAPNMAVSMNNTLGLTNWPIVGATYILVPKNPGDGERALNVFKFFDWAWKNGAGAADQLHYVMLPAAVQTQARGRWEQVKANGQSVWK
jgi:phosphate transport system substrate-binding protein